MHIAELNAFAFRLAMRAPLHLSCGVLAQRCGVLIEAVDDDRRCGLGEVALPPDVTPEAARDLARRCAALAGAAPSLVFDDGVDLDRQLGEFAPALRRGLEMALLDLVARRSGTSLGAQLGGAPRRAVPVNALIDRLPPQAAARAAAAACALGYTCLKIKIDPRDGAAAEAALRAVRAAVGGGVALRVDVNAGWNVAAAAEFLARCEDLCLDYVEQPVASLAELRRLRSRSAVRLAADEAIDGPDAVRAAVECGGADVIVVKPTRLGLRRSAAAIEVARAAGLAIVITSNLDSGVGIAAALQLCALLPEPLPPCGLATADLWQRDLIQPRLTAQRGWLRVPAGPGLGVELDRDAVAELRLPP